MANFAVVDLSNLFHRARHGAMADPETKVGLAFLIVFRSLRRMHREFKIDHIVFAIDRSSWRYAVYPAYKSRRKLSRLTASPVEQEENKLFFAALNDLTTYFSESTRCTVLQANDVEGDDFVGRWIALHPDDQHMIVSGDSDFVQLLAPNVKIFDAINQRMIGIDSIVDDRGRALAFTVSPKDGKIKVGKADSAFVPEADWHRKALFVKLIRGDAGDSVFSAYPGVRYEGKKCSIRAGWDDRLEMGYDWNNLMFQSWEKLVGENEAGDAIKQTVRVIDEYRINQMLIDLTKQPEHVVRRMDETIARTLGEKPSSNVGMAFLKFCKQHDLPSLTKEANDHVIYLNTGYPKETSCKLTLQQSNVSST